METLDDLLSDSDYEGPASKLRLPSHASTAYGARDAANQYRVGAASLEPILEPAEVSTSMATDALGSENCRGENVDDYMDEIDHDEDRVDGESPASGSRFGRFSSYRFDCDTDSQPFPWERSTAIESGHNVATSPGSDGLDEFTELEKQIEALTEAPSSKLSKWELVSDGTPRSSNGENQDTRSRELEKEMSKYGSHLRSSEESVESELYTESALVSGLQKEDDEEKFSMAYSSLDKSSTQVPNLSVSSDAKRVQLGIKSHTDSSLDGCNTPRRTASSPLETSTACSSGVGEKSISGSSEATVSNSGSAAPAGKRPFLKKGSRMPRSLVPHSGAGDVKSNSGKQIPQLKPRSASVPAIPSRPTSDKYSDFHVEVRVPLGPPDRSQAPMPRNAPDPTLDEVTSQDDDIDANYAQTPKTPIGSNSTKAHLGQSSHSAFGHGRVAGGYGARRGYSAQAGGGTSPSFGGLDNYLADDVGKEEYGDRDIADGWADTMPWDCRGTDLDLDDELESGRPSCSNDPAAFGEPPTSKVVQSYFRSSLTPVRQGRPMESQSYSQQQGRWEGSDERSAQRHPSTPELCAPPEPQSTATVERALEAEIKKYEKETEQLKRLRAQVEQSERDIAREREKLHQEVDAEKQALHAEFDAEQAALKRERRRLTQNAERLRQQIADDRDAAEERKQLRERNEQLEEELREKEKRWTRTVDRLQRQVCDLTRKNQELEEEVRRAGLQMQQAQFGLGRSTSATSARGRQPKAAPRARTPNQRGSVGGVAHSSSEPWQAHSVPSKAAADDASSRGVGDLGDVTAEASRPRRQSNSGFERSTSKTRGHPEAWTSKQDSSVVREVKSGEGRTERFFEDGRREVEFSNGLKKVLYPDGQTRVLFQNGDEKEIRADGVVVYRYFATKAVQTTLPDGVELYQFQDGQFEKHHSDGSKEIHFPNGTMKRVQADGSEEVSFADGTVRRSASASHISAH